MLMFELADKSAQNSLCCVHLTESADLPKQTSQKTCIRLRVPSKDLTLTETLEMDANVGAHLPRPALLLSHNQTQSHSRLQQAANASLSLGQQHAGEKKM